MITHKYVDFEMPPSKQLDPGEQEIMDLILKSMRVPDTRPYDERYPMLTAIGFVFPPMDQNPWSDPVDKCRIITLDKPGRCPSCGGVQKRDPRIWKQEYMCEWVENQQPGIYGVQDVPRDGDIGVSKPQKPPLPRYIARTLEYW